MYDVLIQTLFVLQQQQHSATIEWRKDKQVSQPFFTTEAVEGTTERERSNLWRRRLCSWCHLRRRRSAVLPVPRKYISSATKMATLEIVSCLAVPVDFLVAAANNEEVPCLGRVKIIVRPKKPLRGS
jgi:hypothetical protein